MTWEINFLLWLHHILSIPFVKEVTIFITHLGDKGIIWAMIGLYILLVKKDKKTTFVLVCSLLLGLLMTNVIIKNLFVRSRPFDAYPFIELLIKRPMDYSFPSGHSTSSFAASLVLSKYYPKQKWFFFILACLIALSRMILFVHYPTDIIGGIMIGLLSAYTVVELYENIKKDGSIV